MEALHNINNPDCVCLSKLSFKLLEQVIYLVVTDNNNVNNCFVV